VLNSGDPVGAAGVLGPPELLIIDLCAVSPCDVAGLAVLIGTQRRATTRGITFRLSAPGPRSRNCCTSPAGATA